MQYVLESEIREGQRLDCTGAEAAARGLRRAAAIGEVSTISRTESNVNKKSKKKRKKIKFKL
ncbi:hypothetical protein QJS04_geneDACA006351 [Acorus gramineus]|uniref:Uncharacterized protein n=1 Tax=Acorus gramineus TaxID=55184 RepID=A0AAV9AXN6_ACOGR|nr:hypothetical protein QJS04_geneDACA006351 [Acorus gramineus]